MNCHIKLSRLYAYVYCFVLIFVFSSCDDLLEVDNPTSLISKETVFRDDATATAAITGVYSTMIGNTNNFASGALSSITSITALSSDDFINRVGTNIALEQFNNNELNASNQYLTSLWSTPYWIIYQSNSAIAALEKSTTLTEGTRNQLLGEALFIRAFSHFYLINLFGDVPMILTTDYKANTRVGRIDKNIVYDKIIEDLLNAQELIGDTYPSTERVRPNRATVTAMLARVYLYTQDWANAEAQSTLVISNSMYQLESEDLNNTFLSTSLEAIWQLRPTSRTINTWEGNQFILRGIPDYFYLRNEFITSFETGDLRQSNWTKSIVAGGNTYYYPFKYKIRAGGPGSATPVPLTEYSMVFRLAELYLIRAEARANLDKLDEAIEDVDVIRDRAGLPLISDTNPSISSNDLLLAIENERRHELFTEWGHRWFDLKRTSRATAVLSLLKPDWSTNDQLYPIPAKEFLSNPSLGLQNPGY